MITNSRGHQRISPLFLGMVILFYLPVILVSFRALLKENVYRELAAFLNSGLFWKTISFSASEALLSAFFSLLIALPGAYFFGNYSFPGKRYLRSLLVLPFMLPGILVVLGMVVFYGQNGTLNHWLAVLLPGTGVRFSALYGFWGIVLANVFYNFSFCIRILGESWERIDPALREASATLGYSPLRTFMRVTVPLLMPSIGYLFLLVFLYSFLSFTVVLVLGGYLFKTFEVLIYIEANSKLNFDRAIMIAAVQMILLAGILYLQTLFGRRGRITGRFKGTLPELPFFKRWRTGLAAFLYCLLIALFFSGPMMAIIHRSLLRRAMPGAGFSFENYVLLFEDSFRFVVGQNLPAVIVTSIVLASTVAIITTGIAYSLSRGRRLLPWNQGDLWLQLPAGISFITFSLGLFLLGGKFLSPWILVIWAQVFLAFPLVYTSLRSAWRDLGDSVLEAAATLGASPKQVFKTVEFPMMRRALATAAAYAIAFSLGDLAAVLMLGQGKVVTVSVAIYRLIGHYHFAQAVAMGVLFMAISFLLYSVTEDRLT